MKAVPHLRVNVLANAVGQFSSVVLAILCTPFYIQWLGVESYGLIGFYITLQASIGFMEMGLSRACNREIAQYSGLGEAGKQPILNTLRSLEIIYWVVAIMLGITLTAASSVIASSWINSTAFSTEELEQIVTIMAWIIALRWPVGLYSGALMGLQRQVLMNGIQVIISLFSWVGSVVVLWLVHPSIYLFFQWQLLIAVGATVGFSAYTWRAMPGAFSDGQYSIGVIKKIIPFAAGVGSNAMLGTILLQMDKLILSALLSLKQFGYYMLASVVANAISMLATPVSNAVFPRLAQLIGVNKDILHISAIYHLACQAVSALIVPIAVVIVFFSHEVLYVYTGSADIASNTAIILSILVMAKMLHASAIMPYTLQLAYGWVRLSLYINVIAVLCLAPSIYIFVEQYGAVGAAIAWLIVTMAYVFIGVPFMHQKLLPGEWVEWVCSDFMAPLITVTIFMLIVVVLEIEMEGRWMKGSFLLLIGCIALILSCLSLARIRRTVWKYMTQRRSIE